MQIPRWIFCKKWLLAWARHFMFHLNSYLLKLMV
jgi:hypothetical protein